MDTNVTIVLSPSSDVHSPVVSNLKRGNLDNVKPPLNIKKKLLEVNSPSHIPQAKKDKILSPSHIPQAKKSKPCRKFVAPRVSAAPSSDTVFPAQDVRLKQKLKLTNSTVDSVDVDESTATVNDMKSVESANQNVRWAPEFAIFLLSKVMSEVITIM